MKKIIVALKFAIIFYACMKEVSRKLLELEIAAKAFLDENVYSIKMLMKTLKIASFCVLLTRCLVFLLRTVLIIYIKRYIMSI